MKRLHRVGVVGAALLVGVLLALPAAAQPAERRGVTWQEWPAGAVLYQGRRAPCVGYAFVGWETTRPFASANPLEPEWVYREAQLVDEYPGQEPAMVGTSIEAGAAVMQREGHLGAYRYAGEYETVQRFMLTTGPVVVASQWLEGMEEPNSAGMVRLEGKRLGYHAYYCNGINPAYVECVNSWGTAWGREGHFRITIEQFLRLLEMPSTEVLLGVKPAPALYIGRSRE